MFIVADLVSLKATATWQRTSLRYNSFSNDKAPQSIYGQNKHYKSTFL